VLCFTAPARASIAQSTPFVNQAVVNWAFVKGYLQLLQRGGSKGPQSPHVLAATAYGHDTRKTVSDYAVNVKKDVPLSYEV